MDGATPSTFWQGLLSGLGHPIIGLDHLTFILAIGLLTAFASRRPVLPAAFVVTAITGTGLHLLGWTLPLAEIAVALSVLLAGAALLLGKTLHVRGLTGFASIAGIFHGYAYGEAIVGAESTPLLAYLLGFSLIQLAIAGAAFSTCRWLQAHRQTLLAPVLRAGGSLVGLIGLVFLGGQLLG